MCWVQRQDWPTPSKGSCQFGKLMIYHRPPTRKHEGSVYSCGKQTFWNSSSDTSCSIPGTCEDEQVCPAYLKWPFHKSGHPLLCGQGHTGLVNPQTFFCIWAKVTDLKYKGYLVFLVPVSWGSLLAFLCICTSKFGGVLETRSDHFSHFLAFGETEDNEQLRRINFQVLVPTELLPCGSPTSITSLILVAETLILQGAFLPQVTVSL